jgi:DNA replication factor GINS
MTQEERRFHDKLLELIIEWRGELTDRIFKKEKQPAYPQAVAAENKKKEVISEDKKDISKEYIVVRLLRDIPTFVGVDGRNYTLAKEDIAVLSTVNAKALINRKAAVQITVKR